ncbi:MAG: ABC transporter permease [Acidobacteriota bacterium]
MSRSRAPLGLAWALAARYLRGGGRHHSRLLSGTARAAVLSTALGVTAMVIAMALMSGYTHDLRHKLIGLQAEIMATPIGFDAPLADDDARLGELAALDAVARVQRVVYGEGALIGPGAPDGVGVVLRGVDADDPRLEGRVLTAPAQAADGAVPLPGVLLGAELARQLGVAPGDPLRLVVLGLSAAGGPPRMRYRSVRVVGDFRTGFHEFDSAWALLDRAVLTSLRGPDGPTLLELALHDPSATDATVDAAQAILGDRWLVDSWLRLNRELFTALELQRWLLFLVLGLIVVVSTFNVASTLVLLVRERRSDLGVLAALGLPPRRRFQIFLIYGVLLGLVGTALGVLVGVGTAWTITTFELVRFSPEVAAIYFIDAVPFRVRASDLAAIVAFSLLVSVLGCALPARRAARLRPVDALRDVG